MQFMYLYRRDHWTTVTSENHSKSSQNCQWLLVQEFIRKKILEILKHHESHKFFNPQP